MNKLQHRVKKIEEKIPAPHDGFTASVDNVDPPLDLNDPRLKEGVEEFIFTSPYSGEQENRGSGFISPYFKVLFYGGGNVEVWNVALQTLRQNRDYFDSRYRETGWLHFNGEGREAGGVTIIHEA